MTVEEVIERVLEAAAIEQRMPYAGMGGTGSGWVPYVHDQSDMNGWGEKRYQEERATFWERVKSQVTAPEASRWEEVRDWFRLRLDDPRERRALWAWAASKHGGPAFVKFCRGEGIHVETGRRRKDRALVRISASFTSKAVQHSENDTSAVLMDQAEIIYFADKVEAAAFARQEPLRHTWRQDEALQPLFPKSKVKGRRKLVDARERASSTADRAS